MARVKVGIVGVGKMGCLHLEKYARLADHAEPVGVYDTDPQRVEKAAKVFNVQPYTSLAELLVDVDAISITSSTASHFAVAQAALKAGVHVLIEKPMVSSIAQAIELGNLVRQTGLVTQVGFIERFRLSSLARGKRLGRIKWIQGQRLNTAANRELNVDVVFDLMIHDLDLVLTLIGEEPLRVVARGSAFITPHIDLATTQLEFPSGALAQLTASRVALRNSREFQVVTEDAVYHFDFLANQSTRIAFGPNETPEMFGQPDVFTQKDLDCLQIEIADFLQAILHRRPPVVGVAEGIRSLGVCERILEQISPTGPVVPQSDLPSSFYS